MIISAALLLGIVVLFHVQHCYHMAQLQYRSYQQKYCLEGLLQVAVDIAQKDFDFFLEHVFEKEFPGIVIINNRLYDGYISIKIGSKQALLLFVQLRCLNDFQDALCLLTKKGNAFFLSEWCL